MPALYTMLRLSHASVGQPLWISEAFSGYSRQAENLFQVETVQQETSCGQPSAIGRGTLRALRQWAVRWVFVR